MGYSIRTRGMHHYNAYGLEVPVLALPGGEPLRSNVEATRDRPKMSVKPRPGELAVRCSSGRHLVAIVSPSNEIRWSFPGETGVTSFWSVAVDDGYQGGNLADETQSPIETACDCGMIWVLDPEKLRAAFRARKRKVSVVDVETQGVTPGSFYYQQSSERAIAGVMTSGVTEIDEPYLRERHRIAEGIRRIEDTAASEGRELYEEEFEEVKTMLGQIRELDHAFRSSLGTSRHHLA